MKILKKILKVIWNNLKIIACVCLICATFYYGYSYLNGIFRTEDADYGDSFHNMPENSVDAIVLGSSHAQYSFVPSFFYQDTGLYSYMLGSSFQPLNVSYQMLKEALKTQNPELVILEVFSATYQVDNSNGDYDYRYILAEYQMTGEEKYNTIDYVSTKEKALSYKNEFINNHNNWRTIEDVSTLFKKDTSIDTAFGFVGNWEVYIPVDNYWYSSKYENDTDIDLNDEDLEALNNIYNLCEENGIDLLLYMTPMDGVSEDMQTLRHKVWDWANERNISYIDFLQEDEEYDIRSSVHHDGFHTFINGASYITDVLAEYVENNYSIDNHKDNEELENLYRQQIPSLGAATISKEANGEKFLNRLKNYPGTFIVSYRNLEINDKLRTYLDNMGLNDLQENQTFYGVVNNGQLIAQSSQSVNCDIDGHNIVIDDSGIYFDGEFITNEDTLTILPFNYSYDSINVKRIGYLNEKLWDIRFNYDYQLSN